MEDIATDDFLTYQVTDEVLEAAAGDEPELGLMCDASCASTCNGCNMCC